MHKKVQALVVAGLISTNTLAPLADTLVEVDGSVNTAIETRIDSVVEAEEAEESQVYLSDIDYVASQSSTAYKTITKDTNTDGNKIKLLVEEEVVTFDKGMGAHATSTLVYDVSSYKDTYSRFVSYVGVDNAQSGKGNGVDFTIYTSVDGTDWTVAEDLGVLTANKNSAYVDISLKDVNYIKLYAHDNGARANDHAVYGDAKLVKEDYVISSTPIEGLHTLETYDNILSSNSVEENINNNELTILRRAFVERVGYESIQRISNQGEVYSNGIIYLMNNVDALRYFITGGPINVSGSYSRSLRSFCEIHAKYKDVLADTSDDNFNLRLAVSISLTFANINLSRFWIISEKDVSAVNRFEVYQALVKSGKMDEAGNQTNYGKWSTEQFKALPVPMMRWVVGNRMNDDEVFWLADYALNEKANGTDFLSAYTYIDYTSGFNYNKDKYFDQNNYDLFNDKYGFGNYINDYGTRNIYRLWMIFEEGAVCGGLAKTYSNLANTFGRPSSVLGQPGHAATMTWGWSTANNRYEWMLQNDISGWSKSGNEYLDRMLGWGNQSWTSGHSASYNVLATDVVLDYDNYVQATLLNLLADSYTDNNDKKDIYLKALEIQPKNLDSMEGLVNCYNANEDATSAEYLELAKQIIETYTYYPQAMMDLLALIEDKVTDSGDIVQLDLLKNNALVRASKATAQESTCVNMSKQLANKYLDQEGSTELATFSFDGENAKKIVINPKYEGSQIRVRYSLDGGTTWTETEDHIITLTEDELASITAENDIKVGLVGTEEVHDIDILAGNTITSSTIYANDNENLLIGATDNLEFSLDGGVTWCDYVTEEVTRANPNNVDGIRFEGDQTVKVRYKAHGLRLQSNEYEYTFTENQDTDNKKYIPLKHVSLEGFTSQQSTGKDHAATNFIDGTPNTAWHTAFRTETDKFYTVSFDTERNISYLEYLPGNGANGRLRSGQILTSMDGENWEVSGTFTDIGNNKNLKELPLDNPTICKYVKLVATETYGNSTSEQNKYFSGKDITFYEADVNFDDEITTLPDDVPVDTTDTPTVLPDDIPVGEVGVELEGGTGGSADNAATLKVNTLVGLEHVLKTIINSGQQMSLSRLGEIEVIDQDTVMYKLHVIDGTYSYYVNIKVDTSKTELTDLLNKIPETSDDATPEEPSKPDAPVVPEQPETPDTDEPDTEEPPVEDEVIPQPPVEDEEEIIPPVDGETPDEELPEEDGDIETPEPPVESPDTPGEDEDIPQPPVEDEEEIIPPVDGETPDEELPEEDGDIETPEPPVESPDTPGEDEVVPQPPVEEDKPEVDETPEQPPVEDEEDEIIPPESDTEQPSVDDDNNSGEDVNPQPPTEEGTIDNGSETVVDKNNTTTSKPSINNVNTGDTATIGGFLLLGAVSLLGALGIIKKRNKNND